MRLKADHTLSAHEARRLLAAGQGTVVDYVRSLLARVDAREPDVQAWAHLDRAQLLARAEGADRAHDAGTAPGPLFGLPVGFKDIIDTQDMPTEHGSVLHAGRVPDTDATVVARVCAAGGLVMGKTVTTELATYAPGKTRHPHNPAHTPGGSSSGSAAAVAAGMVPLAVGTQTNGSVIRPASFCGVVGFKPSAGLIPRTGVLMQSPALDNIGVFGRCLDDVALLAETLAGPDAKDPLTRLVSVPPMRRLAMADAPTPPTLAWVESPFWGRVAPDAQAAMLGLVARLAGHIASCPLPPDAADAPAWHRTIMEADIAGSFADEFARGQDQLSASLCAQIERGRLTTAVEYRAALTRVPVLRAQVDALFDRFDAIVTPATLGTAPVGLDSTGDPIMCTLWSLLGLPSLSLPLLQGANGLPIGVQLVGRWGDDARLLRSARWLMQTVQAAS